MAIIMFSYPLLYVSYGLTTEMAQYIWYILRETLLNLVVHIQMVLQVIMIQETLRRVAVQFAILWAIWLTLTSKLLLFLGSVMVVDVLTEETPSYNCPTLITS